MKIVYSYDEITKEFNGTTIAQEDVRASKAAGTYVYMMPDNSTQIKPPEVSKNQVAVFNILNNEWEIKLDYRNEVVYNLITREPITIKEIGPIPVGYVKELPERLEDLKTRFLFELKNSFLNYINESKFTINDCTFYYSSLSRLIRERDINIAVSRDDVNKIYLFSKEEYNNVIDYLTVIGQLIYMKKWSLEKDIINCNSIEIIKEFRDNIDFTVSEKEIELIMSLTPAKRKNYLIKLANSI